jgi:hypothetical protein
VTPMIRATKKAILLKSTAHPSHCELAQRGYYSINRGEGKAFAWFWQVAQKPGFLGTRSGTHGLFSSFGEESCPFQQKNRVSL